MSDKFHQQPDNRHQPRGGSSRREKHSSLNCEMNSTSTSSSPQREAEDMFQTGQRFPRGRLGWTRSTHQRPMARDRRVEGTAPHDPAEPSTSPRRRRTPATAHCGPSTVPRGPAGAGELPTPREGCWVHAARALPGPPALHHRASRGSPILVGRRSPAGRRGVARRPARGGTQGWAGSKRPAGRGAVSSEGARAPAAPTAPHLPSARFMPASAAQRGSAGPGPARHRFCFRRQSASSAAAAGPAEGEPEAVRRSCSRATGSVRFLIPWPARPVSPAPPAAAEGSRRRSRRREPAALTSLPAGGPAQSRSELANERREAANPPRPPRPAPSRGPQPS